MSSPTRTTVGSRLAGRSMATLALAMAGGAIVVACSDAEGPPSSGTWVQVPDAGDRLPGVDASARPFPQLCEDLAYGGEVVTLIERVGRPADATGGAILPGTYDLTEQVAYVGTGAFCSDGGAESQEPDGELDPDAEPPAPLPPGPPECAKLRLTDRLARVTLIVTEHTWQRIEVRGRGSAEAAEWEPAEPSAAWQEVQGASLKLHSLCPRAGSVTTVGFSASGAALVLGDGEREEYFVRRP